MTNTSSMMDIDPVGGHLGDQYGGRASKRDFDRLGYDQDYEHEAPPSPSKRSRHDTASLSPQPNWLTPENQIQTPAEARALPFHPYSDESLLPVGFDGAQAITPRVVIHSDDAKGDSSTAVFDTCFGLVSMVVRAGLWWGLVRQSFVC